MGVLVSRAVIVPDELIFPKMSHIGLTSEATLILRNIGGQDQHCSLSLIKVCVNGEQVNEESHNIAEFIFKKGWGLERGSDTPVKVRKKSYH